jgi:hypothetical protein
MSACMRPDNQNETATIAEATISVATVIGLRRGGMMGYDMMLPTTVPESPELFRDGPPAPY